MKLCTVTLSISVALHPRCSVEYRVGPGHRQFHRVDVDVPGALLLLLCKLRRFARPSGPWATAAPNRKGVAAGAMFQKFKIQVQLVPGIKKAGIVRARTVS